MQCESSGCLVALQQICSTKEEFDILFLLKAVFNFVGKVTGVHVAKQWIKKEKNRDRSQENTGGTQRTQHNNNNYDYNINSNNDNHYN